MAWEMGCERPAADALDDAEDDEHPQAGGHAAQHGTDGEQRHAENQKAFAAEQGRQPAGDGQDDGVGDQVGREDPGGFILRGGQAAGDMGQGHVDHRGVDDLHEGAGHHRDGDQPFVDRDRGVVVRSGHLGRTT